MKKLYLITFFVLSACGFEPMYGSVTTPNYGQSADTKMAQIEISTIPDQEGQYLRNALMDRFYKFGRPDTPLYSLKTSKIQERTSDFDITRESEATRRQLKLSTSISLTNLQTNETVLTRSVSATTSYNVLGSEFATRISEGDSREAALNDLARQIELQISLYFNR